MGRGGSPPAMTLWASTDISVNGVDLTGIDLRLQPGMDLAGRIAFEASMLPIPTDLSRITVQLSPAPTAGISVAVNAPRITPENDGTFNLEGIAPGRYLLSATQPVVGTTSGAAWSMKSVRLGDVDVTDGGFEIRPNEPTRNVVLTFTDKVTELSGTLLDPANRPSQALSIIMFSTDRSQWTSRSRRLRPPLRPGTDGKFKFTGLAPGEYFLAALGDFEQADVLKPDFLEQVAAAAMKITLAEGEKKVQDVRIAGGG